METDAARKVVPEAELEREILEGRKFTLEEAIARMVGPGAMKGESPVTRMQQSKYAIETWLGDRIMDSSGALQAVLMRHVTESEFFLRGFEDPLAVLKQCVEHYLESDYALKELVRDADVQWGRILDERPLFEVSGSCHPDDPYTVDGTRINLQELLKQLLT